MTKLMTTAAVLAALLAPAPATALDITYDMGGNIAKRIEMIKALRKSGEKVRIVGACASACTLILTLPPGQVCAVKGAEFGFHAMTLAAKDGSDKPLMRRGKRIRSPDYMQERFASLFPDKIHAWIHQVGALKSVEMTISPATDFVPDCDEVDAQNRAIENVKSGKPVGDSWFTQ